MRTGLTHSPLPSPVLAGQGSQAALQSSDCGAWDLSKGRNLLQLHSLPLSSLNNPARSTQDLKERGHSSWCHLKRHSSLPSLLAPCPAARTFLPPKATLDQVSRLRDRPQRARSGRAWRTGAAGSCRDSSTLPPGPPRATTTAVPAGRGERLTPPRASREAPDLGCGAVRTRESVWLVNKRMRE